MTSANFRRSLTAVLIHEGGYVDHPKDPGGATNLGITQATLARWRRKRVTKSDVKKLTQSEAAAIYRANYWDAVKGDDLPGGVDYCVFDYAVNSGPSRAAKGLQRAVGVRADGAIGPLTMKAVQDKEPSDIIVEMCNKRLAWLKRLKTWKHFGRGWGRRVAGVRKLALEMATNPVPLPPDIEPIEIRTASMGGGAFKAIIELIRLFFGRR